MKQIGILLVVTACCAITSTPMAQIQPPAATTGPRAQLSGRLVAIDGAPIRRAIVRLSLSARAQPLPGTAQPVDSDRTNQGRVAETNEDGRFEFADLPLGLHGLIVEPPAGFVRPVRTRYVTLIEEPTRNITVRLERTGAIAGEVRDERGQAVPGVLVQALTRREFLGHVRVTDHGARAGTDDRGQFRIFNLPAGAYYVVATYERRFTALADAPRSGYASTYSPRAVSMREARLVTVSSGRDVTGVNVELIPTRLSTLVVNAVNSQGVPLDAKASVILTPIDDGDVHRSQQRSPLRQQQNGTFVFPAVPPGTFNLVAATSYGSEDAVYARVRLGTEDLTLNVQTNLGARVSGRVIVDGQPRGSVADAARNVSVSAQPPLGTLSVRYPSMKSTQVPASSDRFELTGLLGPMVLLASMPGGAVISIRRAGEEITGRTLDFQGTEVINDVTVEFTTNVAQVDATVSGTTAPDEPEPVMVVLFHEDPARWLQGNVRYPDTTVSLPPAAQPSPGTGVWRESGSQTVSLGQMIPGRYLIVAIPRPEIDYPTHPRILEGLRPLAVPITLIGGATAKVDLRVTPVR